MFLILCLQFSSNTALLLPQSKLSKLVVPPLAVRPSILSDTLFQRHPLIRIATITAHHLYLTEHEACCDPFAFCKPIPKKPTDRDALVRAVVSGDSKFFL